MKWKASLIELPMKISSKAIDQIVKFLQKNNSLNISKYYRFGSKDISSDQQNLFFDLASKDSIKMLLDLAHHDFYNNKSELADFFNIEEDRDA